MLRSFFGGMGEAGYQRFRTTSMNYYAYDTKALSVGESNQGIVSEKSKWIHQVCRREEEQARYIPPLPPSVKL